MPCDGRANRDVGGVHDAHDAQHAAEALRANLGSDTQVEGPGELAANHRLAFGPRRTALPQPVATLCQGMGKVDVGEQDVERGAGPAQPIERCLLDEHAVAQSDDPVGPGGEPCFVGDQHERAVALLDERRQ